jgi:hypothetical protein
MACRAARGCTARTLDRRNCEAPTTPPAHPAPGHPLGTRQAPDPSPALSAAAESEARAAQLEAKVQKLSTELAEYKAESKAIKNQDLTIRKQEEAIRELQAELEAKAGELEAVRREAAAEADAAVMAQMQARWGRRGGEGQGPARRARGGGLACKLRHGRGRGAWLWGGGRRARRGPARRRRAWLRCWRSAACPPPALRLLQPLDGRLHSAQPSTIRVARKALPFTLT